MPLKVKARKGTEILWITGTIGGRRIRESTRTSDPKLADEYRATREAEIYRAALHGEPERTKYWLFSDAITSYLSERPRSAGTKKRVKRLLEHFGVIAYCTDLTLASLEEMAAKVLRPGHSPATRSREIIGPARAVLEHASERDGCPPPKLKIKIPKSNRTEWLTPRQAAALEASIKPFLRPLVVFLFDTGARAGEAYRLLWEDVHLEYGMATLRKTKNGLDRTVELSPRAVAVLAGISGRDGHVFRQENGDPFKHTRDEEGGGNQLRSPWARAAEKAGLPGRYRITKRPDRANSVAKVFVPRHTPHSARHTWATWHYAEHHDLLLLKEKGGWSSVTLVERYAHIAPSSMLPTIAEWRGISRPVVVPAIRQAG